MSLNNLRKAFDASKKEQVGAFTSQFAKDHPARPDWMPATNVELKVNSDFELYTAIFPQFHADAMAALASESIIDAKDFARDWAAANCPERRSADIALLLDRKDFVAHLEWAVNTDDDTVLTRNIADYL